jgi:outer membrane protein OmpA-like peptidoglycan-associated protein
LYFWTKFKQMKKISISVLVLLTMLSGVAIAGGKDTDNTSASEWSLNLNVAALDFYSPMLNKFSSFQERMAFGPDLTIQRNYFKTGLGVSINFMAPGGLSTKANPNLPALNRHLLMIGPGLTYNFQNAYMLKSSFPVAPYVFANAVGSWIRVPENGSDDKFGVGIPVGAGVNFKVADGVALNVKGGYMFGVTEFFDNNIYWSAGISLGMGKGKDAEPEPVPFEPVIVDTDGDGIPDNEDDCPEVAGLAVFNGCPDTDGDGIKDSEDRCPTEAGSVALQGCPDRDGDGVADIDDKCPDVAGPASNQGCPIEKVEPKKEEPKMEATKEQPKAKVELTVTAVQFDSEDAALSSASMAALDGLVAYLNENKNQNVTFEGHADSTGGEALNKNLSANRAKACADYVVSKGIEASRVASKGFSSSKPIADNTTPEGRAKNRRVDFVLSTK